MSSQSPSTRKHCDFTKLMVAGYDLELNDGSTQDFEVTFHGPKDTAYENGVWKVRVTLPDDYPFASPSIGFVNKLLHPNVDEASGAVCLDVINQTWTPLYSLVNIFEVFLPQLLSYPNPSDPLNADAASLFLRDKKEYEQRVREHVKTFADRKLWEVSKQDLSVDDKDEIDNERASNSPLSPLSDASHSEPVNLDDLDIDDL